MHVNWSRLWDYVYGNRLAIQGALLVLLTAAIKTSPIPKRTGLLWLYDWGHQVFNITNTRLNSAPIITPPSSTAPTPSSTTSPKV